MPGSPAWTAGIDSGSRAVQLAKRPYDEHVRFRKDVIPYVGLANGELEYRHRRDSESRMLKRDDALKLVVGAEVS